MAAKPAWLLHIPEILAQLRLLDVPVVDRAVLEKLFRVRRRRAIHLLQGFGGYRSGNALLVDRLALVQQLETLLASPETAAEHRRKRRLADRLDELDRARQARQVLIPVDWRAWRRRFPELPAGVALAPGRLTVEFEQTEDLLRRLFEVAQAAANDFASFQATVEQNAIRQQIAE